jgi:hypothetical protein
MTAVGRPLGALRNSARTTCVAVSTRSTYVRACSLGALSSLSPRECLLVRRCVRMGAWIAGGSGRLVAWGPQACDARRGARHRCRRIRRLGGTRSLQKRDRMSHTETHSVAVIGSAGSARMEAVASLRGMCYAGGLPRRAGGHHWWQHLQHHRHRLDAHLHRGHRLDTQWNRGECGVCSPFEHPSTALPLVSSAPMRCLAVPHVRLRSPARACTDALEPCARKG